MMKSGPWTSSELALLRGRGDLGAAELACLLDRSVASVRSAAQRSRISLRRPGDCRGRVLGECERRVSPGTRAAIAAAPALVMRRGALYREAALCPDCGRRRIQIPESGLCEPCHVELLERSFSPKRPALERVGDLLDAILEQFGGEELDLQRRAARARKRRQRARGRA
jgi:hypothetical protein